jgi:hypothetical protein
MLETVLDYLHNWFCVDVIHGEFVIDAGRLQLPEGVTVDPQQYVRVFGSIFNDGVHLFGDDDLTDETFTGTVWLLAIPTELLSVVRDIEATVQASASVVANGAPKKSESFDGYSYTLMTRADGSLVDWRDVYAPRLARWRKL